MNDVGFFAIFCFGVFFIIVSYNIVAKTLLDKTIEHEIKNNIDPFLSFFLAVFAPMTVCLFYLKFLLWMVYG